MNHNSNIDSTDYNTTNIIPFFFDDDDDNDADDDDDDDMMTRTTKQKFHSCVREIIEVREISFTGGRLVSTANCHSHLDVSSTSRSEELKSQPIQFQVCTVHHYYQVLLLTN